MSDNNHLKAVVEGNNGFTQKLYNILAKKPGNVFFSPISVHTVLSMVYQGAKGSTLEAFSKTLNVPEPKHTAEGYSAVMSSLNNVPDVTLLIANKIFLKKGYELQSTFKEIVEKHFRSEVETVNFKVPDVAAKNINSWVEQKTNSKIKDLINKDNINDDTRLVLVNAIYFKGNWANKFDPALTKTEDFYVNDNETVNVQMMYRRDKYGFKNDQDLDAKVLELPYANKDLSLIVILPNERNGIAKLEEKLANTNLSTVIDGMYKTEVNVHLPKFKIEATVELNDPLKELGLDVIFGSRANFSGLITAQEPLYVSNVIQKAFIEVNEEGAEAAAATDLHIMMRKAKIRGPVQEFKADHPFTFVLGRKAGKKSKRKRTVVPIFVGRLTNV